MPDNWNCYVGNLWFADLHVPTKCDGCALVAYPKCLGFSSTEIKYNLGLKNRLVKFVCVGCDQGLKELLVLKILINTLLVKVALSVIEASNSNRFEDRIALDNEQIDISIFSIFVDSISVLPLKIICLGRFIKALFFYVWCFWYSRKIKENLHF